MRSYPVIHSIWYVNGTSTPPSWVWKIKFVPWTFCLGKLVQSNSRTSIQTRKDCKSCDIVGWAIHSQYNSYHLSQTFPILYSKDLRNKAHSTPITKGRHSHKTPLCEQESDEIWLASPPAQNSLKHILNSENVTLSMGWEIRRDSPIQGQKSGPDCAGIQNIVLASDTTRALKRLIEVQSQPPHLPYYKIKYPLLDCLVYLPGMCTKFAARTFTNITSAWPKMSFDLPYNLMKYTMCWGREHAWFCARLSYYSQEMHVFAG